MNYSIAIDGPAGAGKSTIAKKLSSKIDYIYVDTGAMYRAISLFLLRNGIKGDDSSKIESILDDINIEISYVDGLQQVFLNEENVSSYIRTEEVGIMASLVAKNKMVRKKLVELQRKIASNNNVVMDGRDIGSCVLPNATLKIYMTASSSKRAYRRWKELSDKGIQTDINEIEKDIIARDNQDMTRKESPLVQAEDAVLLDTSDMSIEEVVSSIETLFKNNLK